MLDRVSKDGKFDVFYIGPIDNLYIIRNNSAFRLVIQRSID